MTRTPISNLSIFNAVLMLFLFSSLSVSPSDCQTKKSAARRTVMQKKVDIAPKPPETRTFNHKFEIEQKYDKFENSTKVLLSMAYGASDHWEHGYIFFSFTYQGETIKSHPEYFIFQYDERAHSYKGNSSTAIFLSGGKKSIVESFRCEYDSGNKV
jgi:hypothetical protein